MKIITSSDNTIFKNLKKLKMKKYREIENCFLAEGKKFLDFSENPEIIIFRENISEEIIKKSDKFNCEKIYLAEKIFKDLSSQENSQGVIICYKSKIKKLENLSDNIVVLNKVSDPGNLGTIIRVSDAAGFKDIILTDGSVDCYNDKTVRSSMGSILSVNISYISEEELISFLKKEKYKVFATALDKNSILYTKIQLENKNAFIFGNEGNGISEKIIEQSDEKIIIPIYGSAESLNVAMASGIILYSVRNILEAK